MQLTQFMATTDPLYLEENVEDIPQVEAIVMEVSSKFDLSEDQKGNMLVSVTEAVNNAMIHGNKNDKSKCVKLHISKVENNISVQVTDEGNGFDHTKLPDPTAPENLLKMSGRGVFLMHNLCDEIDYLNDGRTVKMSFHICQQ